MWSAGSYGVQVVLQCGRPFGKQIWKKADWQSFVSLSVLLLLLQLVSEQPDALNIHKNHGTIQKRAGNGNLEIGSRPLPPFLFLIRTHTLAYSIQNY